MTNVNKNTQNTASTNEYFNGVMYARAFINEIKLIQPKSKKAKQYCAVNATLIAENGEEKSYTNIDLIVKGEKVKKILWNFNDQWPTNRFERNDELFIADINIGSIGHCGFERKNGEAGATLKGRLINIRSLKIGGDVVYGEMSDEFVNPTFVSPAYVNLVDIAKGEAKASLLEGKIGEHDYQNINLSFKDIEVFDEMEAKGLCPKGYKHRDTNPKVFAILELSAIQAVGYLHEQSEEYKSYLTGELATIRYLKANDEVLTKKSVVKEFAKGFKEGWQAA